VLEFTFIIGMVKLVRDEEIDIVKQTLDGFPKLIEYLSDEWVIKVLLTREDRLSKHYLFYELLSRDKATSINHWLNIINQKDEALLDKLVRKIKSSGNQVDFLSLIPEIEALSFYISLNHFDEIYYEPSIGNAKPDIKLVKDTTEIFIEITRIFPDEGITRQSKLEDLLQREMGKIDGSYYVNLKIYPRFEEDDVEPFICGLKRFLGSRLTSERIFNYGEGGKAQVEILGESSKPTIQVATFGPTGGTLESGGRLKFKMMDEVEQLPNGTLNVLIVDIRDIHTDLIDVEEAIYGQEAIRYIGATREVVGTRIPNGFIHTKKGTEVGLIIAFEEYEIMNRRKYINPNAAKKFSEELIDRL